jgi:transposase
MSKARLVITAVVVEGRTQAEVARAHGVSAGWASKLLARYRAEGEVGFESRSRRPNTSPSALSSTVVDQIIELRRKLASTGLDAGPDTIRWYLIEHHGVKVAPASISRHLTKAGLVTPAPDKRPKSSYKRYAAEQPNEMWQSDFTHYEVAGPRGMPVLESEIITWLDDHSRYALHVSAHVRISGSIVLDTSEKALQSTVFQPQR